MVPSRDNNRINALTLALASEQSSSHRRITIITRKGLVGRARDLRLWKPGKNLKWGLARVGFCFRDGSWKEKGPQAARH